MGEKKLDVSDIDLKPGKKTVSKRFLERIADGKILEHTIHLTTRDLAEELQQAQERVDAALWNLNNAQANRPAAVPKFQRKLDDEIARQMEIEKLRNAPVGTTVSVTGMHDLDEAE